MSGGQALVLAAVAAPPAMLLAALHPAVLRRLPFLLWLAPLPALAAALLAGGAPFLVLDPGGLRLGLGLAAADAPLLGAAALLWSAAGAYAGAHLGREAEADRFAVWWLVTLSGSLGVFVAQDLLGFYLAFAAVSLAAFGLIVHDGTPRARRAGAVTLLLAVVGEICLLLAFALMAEAVEGPSLAIAAALAALPGAPAHGLAVALLVAGFGVKAGLVPLHVWLPLAHPAAPMPASAVLSGAIVKAGIVGLLRFLPVETTPEAWGLALAAAGLLTAFWGVGCGITRDDPKAVLAYSTVSQMGVTAAVLGMGIALSVPGTALAVAFYATHHVLAKGALFLGLGLAGMLAGWRRGALLLAPALVLALGFGGLPGTGGALAKLAVKPQLGAGLVGLLAALSAAGSTLLMLHFLRLLAARPAAPGGGRVSPGLLLPWLVLAAAAMGAPWWLHGALGLGGAWAAVAADPLGAAWPVLLGAVLAAGLARAGRVWPGLPDGDVIVLARPLARIGAAAGAAVAQAEAALRAWAAAGLALLTLALVLAVTMLSAAG